MRLTVLGCAGTFPGPDSPCSSYLLEQDGFRLLIDMGNGAMSNLQRCGELFGVDAVVLSHLHADHCLDLVSYAYARHYHPDGAAPRIPVYGPGGTEARLNQVYGSPRRGLGEVYDFRAATPGTFALGPFEVTLARVNHPVECYGVRLQAGGRTFAYSADTGVSEPLVELARNADLFLCEASFLDGTDHPDDVHLTGRQGGEHATLAGAHRLLLTHLVAWGDEQRSLADAASTYAGPLELARACMTYDI
ncbi:MAG: MBL fold metallo-hydrolase [Mycobacteriales bacterium]